MTPREQKVTARVLLPAILTPFAVMSQFGYSVGTINSLSEPLKKFYNYSIQGSSANPEYTLNTLWALTAALLPLGGVIGSLVAKPMGRKFGKRNSLIYTQIIAIVAVILNSISKAFNSFELIMCGQFVMGSYIGIGINLGAMYVAEVSPKHIRGTVGGLFSVFISFGVLMGNVMGLPQVFGTDSNWQYVFVVAIVPPLLFLICSPFLSKSPRSVYLHHKNEAKTRKILQYLRGSCDVENEIKELKREAESLSHVKQMTLWVLIRSRHVRWQLLSAIVIMSSMQLSGFNGLQYSLNSIFLIANIPHDIIPFISIGLLGFQTTFSIGMGFLADKVGRRALLLIGNATMCLSWTAFTICLRYSDVTWVSYLTVACAFGVILGFCIGPGPISYSISPELFDQASRPAAMTLAVCFLWIGLIIVAYITPYLYMYASYLAFLPYLIISFLTVVYIFAVVPETKGKSFLEISRKFDKLNRVSRTRPSHVHAINNVNFQAD